MVGMGATEFSHKHWYSRWVVQRTPVVMVMVRMMMSIGYVPETKKREMMNNNTGTLKRCVGT